VGAFFNGIDQGFSASAAASIWSSSAGPWTVSLWVKPTNLTQTNKYIYCQVKTYQTAIIWEFVNNKAEIYATGYTGTNPRTDSGITLADTGWHHLAWRKAAGTGAYDRFLDGVKTTINAECAITLPSCNTTQYWAKDATTNWFAGGLAEFAMVADALSDEDIATLASGAKPNTVFTPALYIPFRADAVPITPEGLTLTPAGTPTFDEDDHPFESGELGIWSVQAMNDTPILPTTVAGGTLDLSVRACRGQDVPLSFCLRPADASTISLSVTNPASPAPQVDLRWVLCWWQNRSYTYGVYDGGLVPELLVKDPALITVVAGANVSADPFEDAETLQAITLGASKTQQVWVLVHVPATAVTGTYVIPITVTKDGAPYDTVDVTVEVLGFELAPNPMRHGIYYKGTLPTLSEAQYATDMASMVAHGCLYPHCWQDFQITFGPVGADLFAPDTIENKTARLALIHTLLDIRSAAGIVNDPLFVNRIGVAWIGDNPTTQITLAHMIDRIVDADTWLYDNFGIERIYFHGPDDFQSANMPTFKPYFDAIHAAGGHLYSGCMGNSADALTYLGSSLDWPSFNGPDNSPYTGIDTAAWHALGCHVNHYGATIYEQPVLHYRLRLGLGAYRAGFDGVCPYVYYEKWPIPLQTGWEDPITMDLNSPYKDHMVVMYTDNGIVETVQWEGYREAVNDIRFAQTLINLGGTCPDPTGLDLDDVREDMIDDIVALNKPTLVLNG
jgi:hypothetical protein